ncbi:Uncharacterized protein Fot_40122 [Forsythia ovata]|uniref:Uncharacterized protein n=1 Tax=Forsythia ovata TaxID=205694 RepID=A0ABD1S6R5_9LAMI
MRVRGVSDLNAHVTKLSERLDKVEDEIRFLREARNMRTSWGAESEQTRGQRRDQNQQAGVESQAVTGTVFGVQISAKSAPGVSRKWPKQAPDLGEISAIRSRGHRKKQPVADFFGSRGCGSVIHSGAARRMKTGEREQPREE